MRITILPRPLQVRIRAPRLSGCWRWAGSVTPAGYARFNGRYAHRVAWVHVNGQIPERMVLHHACGTRECVRPDHLRLVERGPHIAEHAASRPRLSPEERRERTRQSQRAWQARQRLRGGCRRCVAPALPGRTFCAPHLAAERAAKRLRAARGRLALARRGAPGRPSGRRRADLRPRGPGLRALRGVPGVPRARGRGAERGPHGPGAGAPGGPLLRHTTSRTRPPARGRRPRNPPPAGRGASGCPDRPRGQGLMAPPAARVAPRASQAAPRLTKTERAALAQRLWDGICASPYVFLGLAKTLDEHAPEGEPA